MAKEEHSFTDPDSTIENYREFSPLALGIFVACAFFALLALVANPVFGYIGLAIALWGLLKYHFGKSRLMGYKLALAALCICVFAMSARFCYNKIRMNYMCEVAQSHALEWLEMCQDGKILEPYQLTLTYAKRQDKGTSLAKVYGDEESPMNELSTYLKAEPDKSIRADGTGGKFSFIGAPKYPGYPKYKDSGFDREQIILMCKFEPENKSLGDRTFEIYMERKKHFPQYGPYQWTVHGLVNIDPKYGRSLTKEQQE